MLTVKMAFALPPSLKSFLTSAVMVVGFVFKL
jgi:hypothetical protein